MRGISDASWTICPRCWIANASGKRPALVKLEWAEGGTMVANSAPEASLNGCDCEGSIRIDSILQRKLPD